MCEVEFFGRCCFKEGTTTVLCVSRATEYYQVGNLEVSRIVNEQT